MDPRARRGWVCGAERATKGRCNSSVMTGITNRSNMVRSCRDRKDKRVAKGEPPAARGFADLFTGRPGWNTRHGPAAPVGRAGLAILALVSVAHAGQYPDYQPLSASAYPSYQEQDGIGLAVVPLLDDSSQKRYFGENLLAQGFLPVYIVIENHASAKSAMVLRDRFAYGHDDAAPVSRGQQQSRPVASRPGFWRQMTLAVDDPFLNLAARSAWMRHVSDQRMNLLAKELRSQTVSPGKSGGGFVFVPAGESIDRGRHRTPGFRAAREVFLDLPVKGSQSDQDIHFYFRIEMK